MTNEQNIVTACIHKEGLYHEHQESKLTITWEEFDRDVCTKFQDLDHDNIVGEFNMLT